jgi:hypothetical protein
VPAEEHLLAGGLDLRLVDTARGPRLAGGGDLDALAWVVNGALDHGSEELRRALEHGETYQARAELAGPPSETFDLDAARERWRERTGSELGDDVVVVGTTFTRSEALPRAVVLEILGRLGG